MLLLTKAIFAIMIGFFSSTILGLMLLPLLRRLRVGQKISIFVGDAHRKKEGTPTMGGIIFIVPTVVATIALIAMNKLTYSSNLGIVLLVFIGYACIGFLDDFLSIRKGNNEGLSAYQKLFMQVLIAIGASNAVNLTDGLDGLAGGLSAIAFIAFSLISLSVGFEDIGIFSLILVGSLMGFLIYNTYPAKVFMGDTGSLALGALMGAIAILTHRELTLLVVASIFVIETLSVILQTFWVQVFHRKLFLMTPIHHHFEKLGWMETDIVKLFWVVGLILSMAGIIFGVWV